jgi:hypothetical protein
MSVPPGDTLAWYALALHLPCPSSYVHHIITIVTHLNPIIAGTEVLNS